MIQLTSLIFSATSVVNPFTLVLSQVRRGTGTSAASRAPKAFWAVETASRTRPRAALLRCFLSGFALMVTIDWARVAGVSGQLPCSFLMILHNYSSINP